MGLGRIPLPVNILPLPVPSSVTTPRGVVVGRTTNGKEWVEAGVDLEGAPFKERWLLSLKRNSLKRMTNLVILNQIRKTRKGPHSRAN